MAVSNRMAVVYTVNQMCKISPMKVRQIALTTIAFVILSWSLSCQQGGWGELTEWEAKTVMREWLMLMPDPGQDWNDVTTTRNCWTYLAEFGNTDSWSAEYIKERHVWRMSITDKDHLFNANTWYINERRTKIITAYSFGSEAPNGCV